MLSLKSSKKFQEQLVQIGIQGKLLRLASSNLESKIKQKKFQKEQGLIGINEDKFLSDFKWNTNAVSFLLVISEFESILFNICIDYNKDLIGRTKNTLSQDKFLEVFIGFKEQKDFFSLAFTKGIYDKVSTIDLEYITDLIRVRNFFAHGQKAEYILEKADPKIINDLQTIIKKLCALIESIES